MHSRRDTTGRTPRWNALLLCLGAALLFSSATVGLVGVTDTYKHDAKEIASYSEGVTSDETILTSEALTVAERAVLLEAVTADSAVWTSDPVGMLFQYPDGPETTEYVLELDGSFYRLETSEALRPLAILATGMRISLTVAGSFLLISGAVPVARTVLTPNAVLSRELQQLFGTWLPAWSLLVLVPPIALALVFPVVFETVGEVPLNLFITPFLLAAGVCTILTAIGLHVGDVPNIPFLASAFNVPVLWTVTVAFVVAPSAGEARAALTLLLGLALFSVLVGQTLGWYLLRWRELRQREYPRSPSYWRI